ncbi:7-carboxy-7-deazaguanine synthase QueE [bacterium]|nr:7-carboxy-7-deazaguanine synthase QueE [bacterium]
MNKAKIKEIFISTQGEGPFVGYKQLFIRFCDCNLHCDYCDTDFNSETGMEYSVDDLERKVKALKGFEHVHSVSLTGGEPLLWADFLNEFLPRINKPAYLETNATVHVGLKKVFDNIDYISADIKLPSSSGIKNSFEMHEKFFGSVRDAILTCAATKQYDCERQVLFAKIVFDENIKDEEIEKSVELAEKYDFQIILQPKMNGMKLEIPTPVIENVFDKFLEKHKNTRLIPQVHKFLNIQ